MRIVPNHLLIASIMFYVSITLMIILALVIGNDGQLQSQGQCFYDFQVKPGEKKWFANPNYGYNYSPGSSCKWIVRSDRPMQLTCSIFDIPYTYGCPVNYLQTYEYGALTATNWCGSSGFSVQTSSDHLTITLQSSKQSRGGKFFCTVETLCECGVTNPTRIHGGQETGINEYPMMACLVYKEVRNFQCACGAVIINTKQVMTAAHCVKYRRVSQTQVLIGEHNTNTATETSATRLLQAGSFQIHKNYVAGNFDYDIALVTTVETIQFNPQISPVCLPYQHKNESFVGYKVDVLGWGAHYPGYGPSPTLYKAQMSIIRNDVCREMYSDLTIRQMCTQEPGKDSCQFDSGGPLMWKNEATRRLVLTGIVSEGPVCGNDKPAKNTRVGEFMDWIDSQIPPGVVNCRRE